ncbi:hypothetical protein G8768_17120 [Pseudoteredinibacter isoporae]|uniref:GDYXXLXY protein n=1 Tax=Pseudoteredinibacter isoporae TaxID=570281 RepID=A0A7X0MX71_9GAMM|nr:hypothetical protein [Pseudoteredinibacter isoporae]MBB6523173.1 hypothetical protein [Pseudoteredinibacter isoporae]NHO88691.1 hypothetical protein [Pseudoteredinibacter isoporae]NIB22618.1 hypothetical protein [Pseudoteredinibacter isoporae]
MKKFYNSLNNFERSGLFVSLSIVITLLAFWLLYKPASHFTVSLENISSERLNVIIRGDTAYIIAKIPERHFSSETELHPQNASSINRLSARMGDFEYRVFSADANYEMVLLPYEKYRYQSISCQNLVVIPEQFLHRGRYLDGGIKCNEARDRWKRDNLVYNLDGESQSEFIADLYTPGFKINENEIRIEL